MEIKSIISKIGSSEEQKEYFLSLEISPEVVKSVVWTVKNGKTSVVKVGSVEEWNDNDEKSLLQAVDESISSASEGVNPEPEKVIFGLPENWVKGNEIKLSKKKILGEICSKLHLKPIGFVVTLEALVAFLKEKEGTPLSAIFIYLADTQIIVSLVQLGRILGCQNVGRSEDLAADVREGLARFGQIDNLPSRMILFNGVADFEEAKQQLISFDWQEELPFLHFPKVETLEVVTPVKAVAIAGGAEAAKSMGLPIVTTNEDKKKVNDLAQGMFNEQGKKSEVVLNNELDKEKHKIVDASDLGFVNDKDIFELKETEQNLQQTSSNIDIEKEEVLENNDLNRTEVEVKKPFETIKLNKLSIIKNKLSKISFLSKLRKLSLIFPKLKKSNMVIVYFLIFLSLFLISGFAFYWYIPKAQIDIYLKPKNLEKEIKLTVDTQIKQVSIENNIIPGSFKEIEIQGSKAKQPTGKKLVGKPAKGKIVIYNKTSLAKNFSADTILIGPDKLAFKLDEDILIASKSAQISDDGEQVTYGKSVANVTAVSIGSEFNLAADAQLSFKEYPSSLYSATVDGGLTGGESQEITAVSKEDQEILLQELTEELRMKAKEEVGSKSSSEERVLEDSITVEILEKDFSHEEGEEAENLNLTLNVKFIFLTFKNNDLNQLILMQIADIVPPNFSFNDKNTDIIVGQVDIDENQAHLSTTIKAQLVPQVDKEALRQDIKGRYPEVIQEYFETLPNFSHADIKISPKLPTKLNTLPRIIKNINIEIKIEDN